MTGEVGVEAIGVGVNVAPVAVVVRDGRDSFGKYSPGLKSSFAFCV